MAEFICSNCGEILEIDLSQLDIAEELINQGIEESQSEIEKLEEFLRLLSGGLLQCRNSLCKGT